MRRFATLLSLAVSLGSLAAPLGAADRGARPGAVAVPPPPATRIEVVVDTLHGEVVRDPYRWLERESPERTAWLAAQSERSRRVLASIPGREALAAAIREADRGVTRVAIAGLAGAAPRVFLWRRAPDDNVAQLWMREGWSGKDRLLVDPRTRDQGGVHHAIDYAEPSPDGKYLAYGISASGSEDSQIEVLDIEAGQPLPGRIDRCQYASISWRSDSRSFFYWRRAKPAPEAKPDDWFKFSATYLHVLGDDPEQEQPVFGPRMQPLHIAPESFSWVQVAPGSDWALAGATPGTSADLEYFVSPLGAARPAGMIPWRRLSGPKDHVKGMFAHGDKLYALSYERAPRYRLLEIDAAAGTLENANVFVPESDAVLVDAGAASDAMYVLLLDKGISRIQRVTWDGVRRDEVELPFAGSVEDFQARADRPGIRFALTSWTKPRSLYAFEPGGGVRDLGLVEKWPTSYDHLTSEEVQVRSADGTMVPLSIVRRADARLDGGAPALLEGYASYGIVESPSFWPIGLTWVDRGGVYATCHCRGGGELGEQWHLDGIMHKKENGIDDFLACADYLVAKGYTAGSRLSVTGTSSGGILAGGAITKRPERFSTALLRVPIVNLSRFEHTPGGPANVPEYGSLANAEDARAMLASDPFLRVKRGARYPAVVLTGGLHDVRVPVWMPAKFAARLQAESSGGPVLLRIESDAGHGIGSSRDQIRAEWADLFAFALWQSGVPVALPPKP